MLILLILPSSRLRTGVVGNAGSPSNETRWVREQEGGGGGGGEADDCRCHSASLSKVDDGILSVTRGCEEKREREEERESEDF